MPDDLAANSSPIVGRDRELGVLWARYQQAAAGRAGVALVAGEPGIGKTRLLAGLAELADGAGAAVLRGSAFEAEGMPPYLAWLEALGDHVRREAPDRLRAQVGHSAAVLATILPELPSRLGEAPPSYPLPPEQARLRLFEAVTDLLLAVAAESPLLVVLDDLQWDDAATLDLLVHVGRRAGGTRLLIAGAYRDGDVEANPALGRMIVALNRLRVLTNVTANRLDEDAVAALTALHLGGSPDPSLRRLLFAQSEGNPFFAEELLLGWREAGAIGEGGTGWTLTGTNPPPPRTVLDAVRRRLGGLPIETIDLLRSAAIVGRIFDLALLAEVAGLDEESVEAHLLIAERLGLIRAGDGVFAFCHDKIRECLYEEVAAVRRRRLHGFIGRALELRAAATGTDCLAALAFHYARSGDRERGIEYAEQAARRALATYAFAEAAGHFRTALDLLAADDPRRADLLLGLGEGAMLADAGRDAVKSLVAAECLYRERGDELNAARAAHKRGQALARIEEVAEAQSAFAAALDLLGERELPETVRVLVDLASLLAASLDQIDAAVAYGRRALEIAQRLGDFRLEAAATRAVGQHLIGHGTAIASVVPILERALDLAEQVDDPVEAAEACDLLCHAHYWLGDPGAATEIARRLIAFGERSRDLHQLRHVYTWFAAAELAMGRGAETEAMIARAQQVADRLANPEPSAYVDLIRGRFALWRGDADAAAVSLQRSAEFYRTTKPGIAIWFVSAQAPALLALGDETGATALCAEIEEQLAGYPDEHMGLPVALTYLGMVAIARGDRNGAARYLPRLAQFTGLYAVCLVDRILGPLATLVGDWSAAERYLAAAETKAREVGMPAELAWTLEARADLELARGGKGAADRAYALLEEATNRWRELGWERQHARVAARLAGLAGGQATAARPTFPAGLSEREVDILRLVASGRSNRDIAETLFISEKTVAHHLTSIYAKAGVENRAGATAFALRHGLVL